MERDYLRSVFRWSLVVRTVGFLIFGIVIVLFWYFGVIESDPKPIVFILLPLVFLADLFWIMAVKKAPKSVFFYTLVAFDILAVTAIVFYSGGQDSPFPFLYLIPVVTATLVSIGGTIATSILTIIIYILLLYFFSPAGISFLIWVRILRLILLGSIIIFQSYYLTSNIRKKEEEIIKTRDEFLFRTVHDIRSPAIAIRWLLEKYQNQKLKGRYPDIQKDIDEIKGLLERIQNLSENLLMLAKGQRIEVKKEPLAVPLIVQSILREVQPGIVEKNINFEYNAPQNLPMVFANAELLKEAFANIIGNAVKYNKQDGRLEIKHTIENKFLRTEIINTGPSISSENIKKLFTPFFRGDEEQKIKGTGLGLYISQKIIGEMGGDIGVESSSEEKTVFYILLPLSKPTTLL